ncbi:GlxA family transcriptional regulator [Mesorhizobium sp. YIM 152430]|uniref:GlxA family transcriptional regulator n=1 Tax=Mesorhizobium sp. YIM 152430 TaxID=3031761 RepID=UPI0023DA0580|nr:GlxA family transcriptional regulator [Mesorhizobium sp. YIM 152430]MDF1601859.1 GlxA family transcriptional regulator [Mesorhizobium sp. YIM 152430]
MMQSEKSSIFRAEATPLAVTFLVLPGCSLMCVASVIDPLRAANRICGRQVFDWRIVSVDGTSPQTTSGLPIAVSGPFDAARAGDFVIAIGGFGSRSALSGPELAAFKRAAGASRAVGGIEAGTWVLGHAGLLDGRAATTHWEDLEDFAAAFPEAEVRPDRYVIDGPAVTAGGASPGFDLMLHLIRSRLGMSVALDVASVFIYDQIRAASDAQPLVSLGRLDGHDTRLAQAVRIMESHVDRPLTIAAIARRSKTSVRAMELVFRRAIGESPGAYYLRLRLNAARRLVLDTREPMADIAARTGFSSAAAFSRAFARAFGKPPSAMRKVR